MRKIKKVMFAAAIALAVMSAAACARSGNNASDAPISESTGGAADKVPDPNAPVYTIVSVYVPKEGSGIKQEMDSLESDTLKIEELWDKLKEYKVIPDDSELISFDVADTKGVLNASALNTDNKYIVALGNTLTENFELTGLDINVNGESVAAGYTYNTKFKEVE